MTDSGVMINYDLYIDQLADQSKGPSTDIEKFKFVKVKGLNDNCSIK